MGLGHSPSIVVDGLVFMIDPNNTNSYSGYGNTVYNIVNTSIGGTFVGYTSNPIDNTENRSLFFDGTNDYVDFGSSSLFKLTDNFTLSCWVKSSVYGDRAILGNFGPSSNYSGFNLNIQPSNKFAFLTGSQPNATYLYADSTFSLNTWYHVTGLRRSGTNYLYINGVLQTGSNTQAVASSAQNFYLAKWYSNLTDYYHYGNIGIVSLYNKALSSDEILQNYNATKKKYDPDENIVTNGLILNIDPSKNASYLGTGSNIYDLSGSGNNGTLANSPAFSSLNNGSITFDGTNDYINLGNKFSFITESFSVSYWVFVNSFTTNQANQGPVVFYKGNFNENGYYSQINNDGGFAFVTNNGSNQISFSMTGIVRLKKWHHISIARNGSSVRLYCDGIDVTLTPGTHQNPSASSRDFYLANYNNFIFANIQISQFLLHTRALTQQEVSQNYNATKNRYINALPPVRNGLVLELDAGQRASYPGTGNTWYDVSGNSLNGTLTNGPAFSGIGATSSIVFDRSNDYVNVGDSSLLSTFTGMTLEIIVKYTSTNDQIFVQKWNYALGNDGYTLELLSSAIVGACYSGGGTYLFTSVSNYPINNIYHIVFTLNGSTQTMYINGVLVATNSSGSVPITAGKNLMIGQRSSAGTYFGGNNYLTKFYNRGLSAYEVKQNFDYYRTRYNI